MSQLRRNSRSRGASLAGRTAAGVAAALTGAAAIVSLTPLGAVGAATGTVRHKHTETVHGFDGLASTKSDSLTVFGTAVAGGEAIAAVKDGVDAASQAEALLTPGASSTSKANAAQGTKSGVHGQRCASPAVPAQLAAVVSVSAACSSAFSYSTRAGVAGATGSATGVTINVNLLGLLTSHLPGLPGLPKLPGLPSVPGLGKAPKLPSVGAGKMPALPKVPALAPHPAGGASAPLPPELAALQQVFGKLPKIPAGGISLSQLLSELTAGKLSQVLRVELGGSTTSTLTNSGVGTAEATGGGAEIDLLPGAGAGGAPLLKILVGRATATSVIASGAAHSYAADTPSAVSVTLSTPLGSKVIDLAPGQSQTLLAGTPLASTISAGYGTTSTSPDGTEHATAQSVTIDLLQGVQGGVDLELGSPDSAAAPPQRAVVTTTVTAGSRPPTGQSVAPVPGATTTHTGLAWAGAMPFLLGTFLVGLVLLGLPKARRAAAFALRRVVR